MWAAGAAGAAGQRAAVVSCVGLFGGGAVNEARISALNVLDPGCQWGHLGSGWGAGLQTWC